MINQEITYEEDFPVYFNTKSIEHESMHNHPNSLQIIYLLKGNLKVRVGFEYFDIQEGDFLVINKDDFHFTEGENNIVVSIFIDISFFEKYFKYIRYAVFTCESFQIQNKQKDKVDLLRTILLKMISEFCNQPQGYKITIKEDAFNLVTLLNNDFTVVNFYSTDDRINEKKMDKYYRIMKKLDEDYRDRDMVNELSKEEYYSKFYLAHLFKGLMSFSIQDSLNFTRCWKSEALLLTTDRTIREIALECGFSDAKYYYKHFQKWYQCTPSDFRKLYRDDAKKVDACTQPNMSEVVRIVQKLTENFNELKSDLEPNQKKHWEILIVGQDAECREEIEALIQKIASKHSEIKITISSQGKETQRFERVF